MSETDVESVTDHYRQMLPALDAFRLQLEGLVRVLLAAEGRPVHHIESRCKSAEGFREKITRKGYDAPLQQMTDMVGLRIIR